MMEPNMKASAHDQPYENVILAIIAVRA